MIELLDLQNGVVVPTIHCYNLDFLKKIMDSNPKNYLKVYAYLFYMTCPNPKLNPFFNLPDDEKEEVILQEVKADFSPEEKDIAHALKMCNKLYETPILRAYKGISAMLDRLANYMEVTPITSGRDGNGPFLLSAAKQFKEVRESFKATYADLMEDHGRLRGGSAKAYDQQ